MSQNYRSDIDGLRAIAILSVIIFHAEIIVYGKILFPGGFLGVDVFFVISGYLISSIIFKELKHTSKFNFLNFYEKRARRILPALFIVILASLSVGFFFISPEQYVNLAKSSLSSVFFVSNLYFYSENLAYNADLAVLKPLLHTWSLSVEEQFYLFFPLSIWILYKYIKLNLRNILIFSFILSFLVSIYGSIYHPNITFFIIPTRAWELIAGSILALNKIQKNKDYFSEKLLLQNIICAISIISIFYSMIFFNNNYTWAYIFITVISTYGLIFFYDKNILFKKFLYHKFFTRIGLISYSMYLWHFPIFAFARSKNLISVESLVMFEKDITVKQVEGDHLILKLILIIITLLISIPSYIYIEKFFRNFKKLSTKKFLKTLSIFLILIISFSLIIIFQDGFKVGKRFKILNYVLDNNHIKKEIDEQREKNLNKNFNLNNKEKILIIGNSHGIDFFHMLYFNQDLYEDKEFNIYGTQIRCLLRNLKNEALNNGECLKPHPRQDNRINIKNFNTAETIILATRWHKQQDRHELESVVKYIKSKNKKVYLINNFPEFYNHENSKGNVIDSYVQRNINKIKNLEEIKEKLEIMAFKHIYSDVFDIRKDVIFHAKKNNVKYFDPFEFMCDVKNRKCDFLTNNGEKIYYDYGHVSIEGAKYFGKKMYNLGWFK